MNMKEFIAKLGTDKTLIEKMSKAATPEAAYAVAKEAGLTDTLEEFSAAMKKVNEASGEMNAADVDAITGGASTTEIVSAAASTVASAATVAVAAASV